MTKTEIENELKRLRGVLRTINSSRQFMQGLTCELSDGEERLLNSLKTRALSLAFRIQRLELTMLRAPLRVHSSGEPVYAVEPLGLGYTRQLIRRQAQGEVSTV